MRGASGGTHQNRHLHDLGLPEELRVHGGPGLEQHAGVPGVVGTQLLWHQCQACNTETQRVSEHLQAHGSTLQSVCPDTACPGAV